jgi:hypothetical protein
MSSFADRFAYLPDHPFFRERLEQLVAVSAAARIAEFLALLPRIEQFYDLRFLHDCLRHVVDQLDESGDRVPADWWPILCRIGASCCLSLDVVARLLANAAIWTEERGDPAPWLGLARRRYAFQCGLVASGLTLSPPIPLGLECLPWSIPGQWGFRTGADALQTFSPLAVAHHHPDAVVQLLRQGLSAYAPETLRAVKSPNGTPLTCRADARVMWNHHVGTHWHEDGFRFFHLRMGALIGDFERMLDVPHIRPLQFLMQHRTDDTCAFNAVIDRIHHALDDRVAAPFVLTVVNDASRDSNELVIAPNYHDRPNVHVIFAPPPSPTYIWHDPACSEIDVGEAYEVALVTGLRDVMSMPTSVPTPLQPAIS